MISMKRVVVTGGHGDLAQACAGEFNSAGWIVDAPGRVELDVTNPQVVKTYFEDREVDLLICAAGIVMDRPLMNLSETDWDAVLATHLNGVRNCCRAVLPGWNFRQRGHVVLISSYSALHPPLGQVAYATAKAALLGLTADLAKRHGGAGIRCNAILPGFMETRMTKSVTPARKIQVLADHQLNAFNTVDDTARFIRFLHENLPHTSGQTFQLDSRIF